MKKLKKFFNSLSRATKKNTFVAAASTVMAFGGGAAAAAGPTKAHSTRSETPVTRLVNAETSDAPLNDKPETKPLGLNDGVNYWKHKDYDMVVKTWPCEERGMCASIHAVNTEDANNRLLMAQLKGYAKEVTAPNPMGKGPPVKRYVPDPSQVESWEISAYCGFEADIEMKQKSDGSWKGTITSPFNGGTYGLDIRQTGDDQVKVYGYLTGFPLIKLSEKASRVENPPDACKFSWPNP